jgi:hypothetical protein
MLARRGGDVVTLSLYNVLYVARRGGGTLRVLWRVHGRVMTRAREYFRVCNCVSIARQTRRADALAARE